jgi:hypothetical protein
MAQSTHHDDLILALDTAREVHEQCEGKSDVYIRIGEAHVSIGATKQDSEYVKALKEYGPILKRMLRDKED